MYLQYSWCSQTHIANADCTVAAAAAVVGGPAMQMQACGEPPEDIVADMTNTIAADLPSLAGGAGGGAGGMPDLNLDDVDLGGLGDVPDLKNCPVQ